ncbi:maltose/maltodextrin ABC transporter, substrate binding periplasmic protein MalE [Lachnospiraceae bacterium KM106-2]|nr:maltose/maltodextrin ABC transporter, substrate binding periplasmic protein MalE [Lachnospiraceae bacterium KM106-2]
MKKKVLGLMLGTMVLSTALTGCGSKNDDKKKTDTEDKKASSSELTTDDITLKVWESSGETEDFIKQAGEAFTKKYPNIKIEYENVEVGDVNTQIALDGPAGVGADVFAAPHDQIGGLVSGGHISPVTDEKAIKDSALASCVDAVTYEGKMYGYPVAAETYALFYNKDIIKENEVPKTWEDVEKFSKTFNGKGKYGIIWNVGDAYYSPIFTGMGGNRLFGETGTDTKSTYMNSENAVKGMTYFQKLRKTLNVPAADIADNAVCLSAFTSGKAAMYITGPWNVASCEKEKMNFGVTTLPSLPGEKTPAASFSGARTMQVSAYSTHQNEAQAFAKFCMSEEMQQLRYKLTGALPSIDIDVNSDYVAGFLKQLEYAYPTPSVKEMNGWWDAMKSACSNIWDGADVKKELDASDSATLKGAGK